MNNMLNNKQSEIIKEAVKDQMLSYINDTIGTSTFDPFSWRPSYIGIVYVVNESDEFEDVPSDSLIEQIKIWEREYLWSTKEELRQEYVQSQIDKENGKKGSTLS